MASILKCKTYPSDTVVIQKMCFIEEKPNDSCEIAVTVNEQTIICTRLKKIDRSTTIERNNSVKFQIGSDIKSIDADADDNDNDIIETKDNPIDKSNENHLNQNISIDYAPFKSIPIPSDLKHDTTYDGSIVYRVDY